MKDLKLERRNSGRYFEENMCEVLRKKTPDLTRLRWEIHKGQGERSLSLGTLDRKVGVVKSQGDKTREKIEGASSRLRNFDLGKL